MRLTTKAGDGPMIALSTLATRFPGATEEHPGYVRIPYEDAISDAGEIHVACPDRDAPHRWQVDIYPDGVDGTDVCDIDSEEIDAPTTDVLIARINDLLDALTAGW